MVGTYFYSNFAYCDCIVVVVVIFVDRLKGSFVGIIERQRERERDRGGIDDKGGCCCLLSVVNLVTDEIFLYHSIIGIFFTYFIL